MDHIDRTAPDGWPDTEAAPEESNLSAAESPEPEPRTARHPVRGTHLPDDLNLRHREIIRLAFSGLTASTIAEQVGMTVSTVRLILKSPLAQAEISRLTERANDSITNVPMRVRLLNELTKAGTDALHINGSLMRDPAVDPRVRAGIGRHFLDRIVFGKVDDEREGSYREILRGIDRLERQLDPAVVLTQPRTSEATGVGGAAGGPEPTLG